MSADASFECSPVATWLDRTFALVPMLDGVALDAALTHSEQLARRFDALRSALVTRGLEVTRFKADGHRRASGWVAARTGAHRHQAGVQARGARALGSMPQLRAAFQAGALSFEAIEMITRRFDDDRFGRRLIAEDETLTSFSNGRSSDEIRRAMTGWERMADPVGEADAAGQAHQRRRTRIVRKRGEVRIHASFGATQGEEVAAVLARFAEREFEQDVADAADGELPRSTDQRSADALASAMRTAGEWFDHDEAACPECGTPVPAPGGGREPLTNLMFDAESLRLWATGEPEGPIDADRIRNFAAGTTDGHALPADDIVRAMILGQVRVLVRRADGVITSVGRRQRLFRGRQRDAVVLLAPTCVWPGCHVPASKCEADHLHPHSDGGATSSDNGGPVCDFHNDWKARHGYRIIREHDGRWHVLRPDGTSITGHPPPRKRAGPDAA